MASAELREEITCPICLSIYTAPVTLSCGHTYCLSCINKTRDNQEEYSCPECKHKLRRPERKRNLRLRNIAVNFQPTKPVRKTGIFCTFCIHSPVPAAKSCLLCEASLCDTHLKVHSKSEEHVLTEPTTSWVNRKCSIHKELLKYYCTEDDACICVSCFLAGEHRGHQVELLNEATEKKKKKLRNVLQKLITKREKTEKRVQNLQKHRRGVQEKAAGVTERLTALIRDIRKQLEDLEKRVLSDITQQQEQLLLTISDLIQQLEKEKDELTRKMSHIEELCNMTDPLTVLQEQESHRDYFCGAEKGDNEVTQRDDKQVPAGGDLDEGLISVTLYRGLADIVTDVKRGLYVQETSDILLDINTAGNTVIVSSNMKSASRSNIDQLQPETPQRFTDNPQILSTRSFSSGQHYWEAEICESGIWKVGVCYPSMERVGERSMIGNNTKSWCLYGWDKDVSVTHNTLVTSLHHFLSCDRIGILLDYEAGRLTFYELCDPIRHLHTVTVTFTEPLHAAILILDGWISDGRETESTGKSGQCQLRHQGATSLLPHCHCLRVVQKMSQGQMWTCLISKTDNYWGGSCPSLLAGTGIGLGGWRRTSRSGDTDKALPSRFVPATGGEAPYCRHCSTGPTGSHTQCILKSFTGVLKKKLTFIYNKYISKL